MNVLNTPKVSVIIPVYNGEKTLDRCLQSVTKQSYKNLEIIVVDDGSTDKTKSICEYWANHDGRIKVFHKELDHVCEARNLGLKQVSGDFLSWVDADDFLELNMYERMMKQFSNKSEADIVICNTIVHYSNGKVHNADKISFSELDGGEAIRRIIVNSESGYALWNKLFRMSIVRKTGAHFLRISGKYSEDALWMMENFSNANKVIAINDCLYQYVLNVNSTSRGGKLTEEKLRQWTEGVMIFSEQFAKLNLQKKVKEDITFKVKRYVYFLQYTAYINNYKDSYEKLTALLSNSSMKCLQSDFNNIVFKEMKFKMPIFVVRISHKIFLSLNLLKSA